MIIVDSSVWIDYFRGVETPQTKKLDQLLGVVPLAIGDLILAEVLQGCSSDKEFSEVRQTLSALSVVNLGGVDIAIAAAKNFRKLRALGVTVRKTIDTVIATRCIMDGHELLHRGRTFDASQQHLGLRCMACEA